MVQIKFKKKEKEKKIVGKGQLIGEVYYAFTRRYAQMSRRIFNELQCKNHFLILRFISYVFSFLKR